MQASGLCETEWRFVGRLAEPACCYCTRRICFLSRVVFFFCRSTNVNPSVHHPCLLFPSIFYQNRLLRFSAKFAFGCKDRGRWRGPCAMLKRVALLMQLTTPNVCRFSPAHTCGAGARPPLACGPDPNSATWNQQLLVPRVTPPFLRRPCLVRAPSAWHCVRSVTVRPISNYLTWVVHPIVCMVLHVLAQYPLRTMGNEAMRCTAAIGHAGTHSILCTGAFF